MSCRYFHIVRNDPRIFCRSDLSSGFSGPAYFKKVILVDEEVSCFSGVADFVDSTDLVEKKGLS